MSNIKYRLRNRNINTATNDGNSNAAGKELKKRTDVSRPQKSRTPAVFNSSSSTQVTNGKLRKRRIGTASAEQQVSEQNEEVPQQLRKCEPKVDPRFDFDGMQAKNIEHVATYAFEIFQFMRHQEKHYQLPAMLASATITESQRAMVIDWLIECQETFSYAHETLYIAVRLFDTYLVYNPHIARNRLQLLGGACFLVAAKYEEYEALRIRELEDLCVNAYPRKDFLVMELEVIRAAGGDLGFPLSYSFLRRFARVIHTNLPTLTMARFVLEASLHFYEFVLELPSKVAAAALVLALKKTGFNQDWIPCLEYHSGYLISQLEPLVQQLDTNIRHFKTSFAHCDVVIEKYSDTNFYEVAKSFFR